MLHRLRNLLGHDHAAAHLTGLQLGLVAALSLGLTLAAATTTSASAPPGGGAAIAAPRLSMALTAATQEEPAHGEEAVIRLQDMTPEQARLWNAANPVSTLPSPAAKPFRLETEGVLDEARATDCMTAAIYYEAANESLDGQRAVAQVVINRLRHPAFPKTVCGVVFQGSERASGCQFTFTCDGALARQPDEIRWTAARKVAEAALHGYVMKKIGAATHYHAVYVAPYWSPTLIKVRTIGAHIFYRWTGSSGLPPAFDGRYAGGEAKGLQVATLDNLSRGRTTLALTPANAVAEAAVAKAEETEIAQPAESAALPAVVEAAPIVPPTPTLAPAEDLDWQGRPKAKGPPRLAMPSAGGAGGLSF